MFGDTDYHDKAQKILDRKNFTDIIDDLVDNFFGTELEFIAFMLEYLPELPIDDESE